MFGVLSGAELVVGDLPPRILINMEPKKAGPRVKDSKIPFHQTLFGQRMCFKGCSRDLRVPFAQTKKVVVRMSMLVGGKVCFFFG